jgi:hypothetical protein
MAQQTKRTHEELKRYNEAQIHEIHDYKWIESEKAERDLFPGEKGFTQAALDWIKKYAKEFNYFWTNNKEEITCENCRYAAMCVNKNN